MVFLLYGVETASLVHFVRTTKLAKQKLVNCWAESRNLLSLRCFSALL